MSPGLSRMVRRLCILSGDEDKVIHVGDAKDGLGQELLDLVLNSRNESGALALAAPNNYRILTSRSTSVELRPALDISGTTTASVNGLSASVYLSDIRMDELMRKAELISTGSVEILVATPGKVWSRKTVVARLHIPTVITIITTADVTMARGATCARGTPGRWDYRNNSGSKEGHCDLFSDFGTVASQVGDSALLN